MTPEIREALESACTVALGGPRRRSVRVVRAIVYAVVEQLDSDMTVGDLADALCIAEDQS